jgi:hypothetical protein
MNFQLSWSEVACLTRRCSLQICLCCGVSAALVAAILLEAEIRRSGDISFGGMLTY